MDFPRPLTQNERAILERLVPPDGVPDAGTYRRQLDHVVVVGRCPCGCPSIDLRVDESAPRSAHPGDPSLPLWGAAGEPGDLMDLSVWAPDGFLTELEVMYYGSRVPCSLPDAGDVVVGPAPETIRVD